MSDRISAPPVQIECVQGIQVVAVHGRLDGDRAPIFEAQVAPVLAQPCPRILIDMEALTYMSSLGLRSIFKLIKHATVSGGRAGAFSICPDVLEVLEMSGFRKLMDIYPDRETALRA